MEYSAMFGYESRNAASRLKIALELNRLTISLVIIYRSL